MSIHITWNEITELSLPTFETTIPSGLDGTFVEYRVPDPNVPGDYQYNCYLNTGELDQRPGCASELFTILFKGIVTSIPETFETIYQHTSIVTPTIEVIA